MPFRQQAITWAKVDLLACRHRAPLRHNDLPHQVPPYFVTSDRPWWVMKSAKTQSPCNDVIMSAMASQITGVSIVCSTVCSETDQRKQQSSASPVFVRGTHRWPADSPHKGSVTRKIFPFDNVIMFIFQLLIFMILWNGELNSSNHVHI